MRACSSTVTISLAWRSFHPASKGPFHKREGSSRKDMPCALDQFFEICLVRLLERTGQFSYSLRLLESICCFCFVSLPGSGLQSWLGGLRSSAPVLVCFAEHGELAVTHCSLASGLLGHRALGASKKKRLLESIDIASSWIPWSNSPKTQFSGRRLLGRLCPPNSSSPGQNKGSLISVLVDTDLIKLCHCRRKSYSETEANGRKPFLHRIERQRICFSHLVHRKRSAYRTQDPHFLSLLSSS